MLPVSQPIASQLASTVNCWFGNEKSVFGMSKGRLVLLHQNHIAAAAACRADVGQLCAGQFPARQGSVHSILKTLLESLTNGLDPFDVVDVFVKEGTTQQVVESYV